MEDVSGLLQMSIEECTKANVLLFVLQSEGEEEGEGEGGNKG